MPVNTTKQRTQLSEIITVKLSAEVSNDTAKDEIFTAANNSRSVYCWKAKFR